MADSTRQALVARATRRILAGWRAAEARTPPAPPQLDQVAAVLDVAELRALLADWHEASLRLAGQSDALRTLRRRTEAALGLPEGPR